MSYKIDPFEVALIEGCLCNDRKAQKKLYYRYCNGMFTIAYRILNNEEDAHDALQDAFMKVFKDIENFRKESALGAWIKTIVIRSAVKLLEKEKLFTNLPENGDDFQIIWPSDLTGEYLEKAILSLPAGYRIVFLLIEVEGYSHKEVAQMLHISEGTSKSQLFHAKKQLQKKLKELIDY